MHVAWASTRTCFGFGSISQVIATGSYGHTTLGRLDWLNIWSSASQ